MELWSILNMNPVDNTIYTNTVHSSTGLIYRYITQQHTTTSPDSIGYCSRPYYDVILKHKALAELFSGVTRGWPTAPLKSYWPPKWPPLGFWDLIGRLWIYWYFLPRRADSKTYHSLETCNIIFRQTASQHGLQVRRQRGAVCFARMLSLMNLREIVKHG